MKKVANSQPRPGGHQPHHKTSRRTKAGNILSLGIYVSSAKCEETIMQTSHTSFSKVIFFLVGEPRYRRVLFLFRVLDHVFSNGPSLDFLRLHIVRFIFFKGDWIFAIFSTYFGY
jgi:hypothetical protein